MRDAEEVFSDPRLAEGQSFADAAERAERAGDGRKAEDGYARAADLHHRVALDVEGLPRIRSTIAVSAVCLAARAGRFDLAVRYGERHLAEPGSLAAEGIDELEALLVTYRRAMRESSAERHPVARHDSRVFEWRAQTRRHFARPHAA